MNNWLTRVLAAAILGLTFGTAARAQSTLPKALQGGYPVKWEGWTFHWKILPRQGVVLTQVAFQDKSVLKYAGIAEVFVPYNSGWPRPQDQREHPFGKHLLPLEPGLDCLPGGECRAYAADGIRNDKRGVVMLHEEAASVVYLGERGRGQAKTLTLWSAYALGDYTYIVRWRFGEDGSLQPQVGLTGKLSHFGGDATNSTEVGARERALGHVHNIFFCLDFDVDGIRNTVEEFNWTPTGDAGEKAIGAWTAIPKETGRELKPESFRSWRVVNHASKNRLGLPRSYEIVPGGTGIYRGATREKFAHADLWVTKFKSDEVPGVRLVAEGLAQHANDESVENEDVVLWYMLSVHHQPRTEDWAAMPVDWCGFKIMPRDFLDRSPVKTR